MTTPKEKIQAMIATAKAALPGPWHWPSRINGEYSVATDAQSPLGELIVCTPNSNFTWCKATAAHIAQANPTSFITLAESLLACLEALDNIAGAKLRVDPTPNVETCHASQTLANVTKKLESL